MTKIVYETPRPHGTVVSLEFTPQQVKRWAVCVLQEEVDIRDCINSLEVKLNELKMLAKAVRQEGKEREVTADDVYSNRKRGSNIAGD